MKKSIVLKRRVASPANSECDSAKFITLDWTNWWEDRSFGSFYIHVGSKDKDDRIRTWHRVYPRTIAGYTCSHLGGHDGTLFWHYRFNEPPTTKTK